MKESLSLALASSIASEVFSGVCASKKGEVLSSNTEEGGHTEQEQEERWNRGV
jgi:hypothetical protein